MEINFKDAQVYVSSNYNADICLRCASTRDIDGNKVDARTQIPVNISMDHVQALKLAMQILQRLDVHDSRGCS